jgi:hypothetical protein
MADIVKNLNQVRVYLGGGKNPMDNMFDATFRNNIWSVTVSAGPDSSGMVFTDTETMREFFEAGLEVVKRIDPAG